MLTDILIIWFLSITMSTLILCGHPTKDAHNPPACEIFCRGKLLEVVQNAQIYSDSKTFVDMTMKLPISKIRSEFDKMMKDTEGKPSKVYVKRFVRRCFTSAGADIKRKTPIDWVENPRMLKTIRDRHFKEWAQDLHYLWKRFGRIVKPDVLKKPDKYSIVYVPNLVIVPGGRYREYYYWDSYWIIIGLLRSEMNQTVKGMISNYLTLTETYGYVPNAGRVYNLNRSNPPLLIPMMNEYYKVTKDINFIVASIGTLEKEFNFWLNKRVINVKVKGNTHKLARYDSEATGPRPEAYKDDLQIATSIKSLADKQEFFRNIVAACESGWDLSSRWILHSKKTFANLTGIKTRHILPVDLNAILCWNARILSEFYAMLNMADKKSSYEQIATDFQRSVTEVMWSEDDGSWFDYDMLAEKRRKDFYASNIFPLWTECYDAKRKDIIGSKVTKYLKSLKVDEFVGGIPSSLVRSRLQWDYPNALAPMQHAIIMGLRKSRNKDAGELALKLAENWIHSTFQGYSFTKAMFSKYNAEYRGLKGGDVYIVAQVGYGWTNAVCLDLLLRYGHQILSEPVSVASRHIPPPINFQITFVICVIFLRTI